MRMDFLGMKSLRKKRVTENRCLAEAPRYMVPEKREKGGPKSALAGSKKY
jgi:hypothetical protein